MTLHVLNSSHAAEWTEIVERSTRFDFYHLPQYHQLAESMGEGQALLLNYVEGQYSIALPLLLRRLDRLPGISHVGANWQDATSVYGYAGPLVSHANLPETVVRNFQVSVERHLKDQGVVTLFTRLHPLLDQQALVSGMGECRTLSRTVSIDLTLRPEEQRVQFRKSQKEGVNKLRRQGVECVYDADQAYLEDFIEIYYATMRRVGAAPSYFFSKDYFYKLSAALGKRFHLFVCLHQGAVLSAGIFVNCSGILQYHLGGTADSALSLAPMKLLLEGARIWGIEAGLECYHLGGGATSSPDDSLLHFKKGFSKRTHEFMVWRWALLPDLYQRLCAEKSRWDEQNQQCVMGSGFFPEYRTPSVPNAASAPYLVGPQLAEQTSGANS